MRPPILRSKLRPPAAAPGWVERSRLVDRLATSTDRIWVVTAPAGFGKTTLIARVVEREARRTAWVSLDDADNTPVRFWSHVLSALAAAGLDVDAAFGPLIDGRTDLALDLLLAAVETDGEPITLVLDDAHELTDDRVASGVERLVGQLPDALTLVFTSRHELELGLARRRSHRVVLDLGARDLAFTPEEGRAALSADGLDELAADGADELVERIEGWPAGIQLARLAVRSGGSPGSAAVKTVTGASPDVMAYLAAEVVAALDEDVRRFLIDTSILADLSPSLCDAVTGRTDSLAVLRRLAADQVFTSLVEPASSTHRMHRLFREFLLAELEAEREEHRRSLHRRAMRWYLNDEDLDRIVWHATQASEHDVALRAFRDRLVHASNRGQVDDMWRWIGWIGAERLLTTPTLGAIPAWVSLNQRRYDAIDPWLDAIVMVDDVDPAHRREFELQADAVRAGRDRHLGRLDDALASSRRAVDRLGDDDDLLIVPTLLATHAQLLALTGDPAAAQWARAAIDGAARRGVDPPIVMAYAALGLAESDPEAASAAADSALSLVTTADLERFHRPAMAWVARARAELALGQIADANQSAARAIEIGEAGDEPAVIVLAEVVRARVAHLLGDDDERRAALRRADDGLGAMTGAEWIADEVRSAHAATRFAPGAELDRLPVGARELSERELAVLRLLPFELSRRELAKQLFVSENTVKTHLTSIRRKLGLSGRGDVVGRARELGLLPDD